ncbi:MAG TPA: ABC transporter ATP-binding protein [Acidimicrobiia bacterium]|nr:ABC transporter ATP-binding protein [Acidimicrobiia bacterium]
MVGPADPPAISVAGLEKRYGSVTAVDGLDFEVRAGEVFGLLGPNGAGKTTTVEILEGYRRPDAGEVRVLGLDPWSEGDRLRPRIGVMLQEGGLHPAMRPRELVRLFAAFYPHAEDPDGLLELVGLPVRSRTTIRHLSGGERQRLSLACALVGRPRVVFLDEPTAGMDPHARATTWNLVRELRSLGKTVLLTTHAMDEAEQLCDRVAILMDGRLAALGAPRELTRRAAAEEVRFRTVAGLDLRALARALGIDAGAVVEEHAGDYLIRVAGTPQLVVALAMHLHAHDVLVHDVHVGRRSLEEVFLQLTADPTS